ncbi:uncharacterized protein DNG_08350 [Cephalotrichum gorgonifer]|uniref:Amine oxidase domain-containing protein n=1 Tax=Cephalotrichum gorgonifer TaxID=2041049 RepID=A0AAE8N5U3_9PEZI|nr:uncharacterized protein DNG_08350 [Cephalotrichum gorgonifer]
MAHSQSKRVAVVGSGCAGLAAVWVLKDTHHDVFLYESADRLGGHTNTVQWTSGKHTTAVDTGFIVLNEATYPNFINFLKVVDVPIDPTDMTFAVSRDGGLFEWAGTSLASVFCQPTHLISPRFWRMLFDVVRFNHFAKDLLVEEDERRGAPAASGYDPLPASIGEYLDKEGYSEAFRNDYLIPMTAAVWSTSPDKCALAFPAATLVRFFWNHHLLSTITARPSWLTLRRCGQSYIDAIMKDFPADHIFLNEPVRSLVNEPSGKVRLLLENGSTALYDHVILATHGDQAYSIIQPSATPEEAAILSAFKTSPNKAVLHSDTSLLPRKALARSCWNYITTSSSGRGTDNVDSICLTYDMNSLQHIPRATFGDVLVTLNPLRPPRPETVRAEFEYAHPLYTPEAVAAQRELRKIQGRRGVSYAGAWTGYGFHEDGFTSGLRAAEGLGGRVPFEVRDSTYSRGVRPESGFRERVLRAVILVVQVVIVSSIEKVFGSRRSSLEGEKKRL